MKGLLLKDFYTLTKQMKVFLAIILIWTMIPGFSASSYAVIYAGMMPVTALAYDERSKWDHLAAMMPYTTGSIVLSKYVLGYILVGLVALLSFIVQLVMSLAQGTPLGLEHVFMIVSVVSVAFIFQAINLPVMFRLGVEKGRYIFFLLVAAFISALTVFQSRLVDVFQNIAIRPGLLAVIFIVTTLVLNVLSIGLAIRLYKSKTQ